jgi:hypothetical protein
MKLFKTFSAMVLASMLVVVGCGEKKADIPAKDADAKAMDTPGAGVPDGMEVAPEPAPEDQDADAAAPDGDGEAAADVPAADVPAADEPAADEPAADGGDEG